MPKKIKMPKIIIIFGIFYSKKKNKKTNGTKQNLRIQKSQIKIYHDQLISFYIINAFMIV